MSSFLSLPGTSGNYASTPDAAALDIVGDIDLRVRVALDDWTPSSSNNVLIAKRGGAGSRSWFLQISTTGKIQLIWSEDGTTQINIESTIATSVADGEIKWIRSTLDVDNGASGNDVEFFLSDDGVSWSQLGSTVTTADVTSIFSGSRIVEIGSLSTGTGNLLVGKAYRAQILDGIDGTLVFDARFDLEDPGTTSFTESSAQAATVTVNQSGDPQAEIVADALHQRSYPRGAVTNVLRGAV